MTVFGKSFAYFGGERTVSYQRLRDLRRRTSHLLKSLMRGRKIVRERGEVRYMIDDQERGLLEKVGGFLADLSKISGNFVLPQTDEETVCLMADVSRAIRENKSIALVTPVCPDWSRDSEGRYDFKSLSGGESFVANKFFVNAPEFLEIFRKNGISYRGIILFADWGLETEIDAKDTYGQKLSPDDIQMCFASTLAATDQTLKHLQDDERLGPLFADYEVISMREFLAERLDEQQVMDKMRRFFTTDKQGLKLLDLLDRDSLKLNKQRLRVSDEENRKLALQTSIEYATVGQALDDDSFLVVCESKTTSRCYNLPRARDKKVPVFYVKGKEGLNSGVNIL